MATPAPRGYIVPSGPESGAIHGPAESGLDDIAAAAVFCVSGLGCASKHAQAEDEAQSKAVKAGTVTSVNKMCAFENDDPVNPTITPVIWKGQKVGFCCDNCKPRWAKLTAAEKDAALAKAMATPVPE